MGAITLTSEAEKEVLEKGYPSFINGIDLKSIKENLADMLEHIGDNDMFIEYTMHNITHVDGMLALLEKIIPQETKEVMTQADWLMTVCAVYFHDIGMYITNNEFDNRESDSDFLKFAAEVKSNKENLVFLNSLKDGNDARFLYQEYVRKNHGKRVCEWILHCKEHTDVMPYQLVNKMIGNFDDDFRKDLAYVCQSHQEDELSPKLQQVDVAYGSKDQDKVNLLYCCILLRVADIMHFTSDRTPTVEYMLVNPQNEISKMEWLKQAGIKSVDPRVEKDVEGKADNNIAKYAFECQGRFNNDEAYFSFSSFAKYAQRELERCNKWAEESRVSYGNRYIFPWRELDIDRVDADGFNKKKLKFEIDQNSILKLLTGHTLYNDSTVVLRELIQNSIDAGRFYDANSKTNAAYKLKINIHWDSTTRILTLSDNATGMDMHTITNYLLRVGASKYRSAEAKEEVPNFHSISRFGIGLLTCFMISDDVDIYTLDEKENECHLLKIRKLTGEYLIRNDADRNRILGGKHGSTFELTVRNGINMTEIEKQIRQWVIIPFGSVNLTVDSKPSISIGYNSVEEAITKFASTKKGITVDEQKYRVRKKERDGVQMACLQQYSEWNNTWSLYNYNEDGYVREAPIGICIQGIRVVDRTPGFISRNYLVLVNCEGIQSPETNVARNELEAGSRLEEMYGKVYEMYLELITEQIDFLKTTNSVLAIADKIAYLIDRLALEYGYRKPFANKDTYLQKLREQKCNVIDNGKELSFVSIAELGDEVWALDSKSYDSAVSLLLNMNTKKTTALKLIIDLQEENLGINDPLLLNHSMSEQIYEVFINEFDVKKIIIDKLNRTLKFLFSRKNIRWTKVEPSHSRFSRSRLYVPVSDATDLEIKGLEDEFAIVSRDGVFLNPKTSIVTLLNSINATKDMKDKAFDIIGNYILSIVKEPGKLNQRKFDNYFSSDDNYLKDEIWQIISREDLQAALPDNRLSVCDFYRYSTGREIFR